MKKTFSLFSAVAVIMILCATVFASDLSNSSESDSAVTAPVFMPESVSDFAAESISELEPAVDSAAISAPESESAVNSVTVSAPVLNSEPIAIPEPLPEPIIAPVHFPVPTTVPATRSPDPAAQGKQTIAVYMAGEEPRDARGVHNILGGELARSISGSDRYTAVDRTDAILRQLAREHTFQRSGAVSDDQIKSLGQQLGVQYLCIAGISPAGRQSYYLDVRLVDVVTAEIIRTVTANSSLRDAGEMRSVARSLAYELIETEKARHDRERKKRLLLSTAVSLDVIGLGLIAYGVVENGNMRTRIENAKFTDAERAKTRRDAAYIAGGALIASGITIHILF